MSDDVSTRHARTVERAPLPTDPNLCPPIEPDFAVALDAALRSIGIELRPGVRAGIEAHVRLLLAWNAAINLTAIRMPAAIALDHVADALTAISIVRAMGIVKRPALLDLGSGAGYPGLPLALALPARRVTLVDSVAKKARFLQVAGAAAVSVVEHGGEPAPQLEVLAQRAEVLAYDRRHRGRQDLVTARAVGSLTELVELGLPFLRRGGRLVAWKRAGVDQTLPADHSPHRRPGAVERPTLADELADAERLLSVLGGVLEGVEAVRVPGLEDHRLVVVRADHPTPTAYPRSPAERRRDRR
ncbi:MAG: 16S rRNA (guanine(527)-N(7))-methyltransferase RsmG [Candidatus Limnocylindrales bacterium]